MCGGGSDPEAQVIHAVCMWRKIFDLNKTKQISPYPSCVWPVSGVQPPPKAASASLTCCILIPWKLVTDRLPPKIIFIFNRSAHLVILSINWLIVYRISDVCKASVCELKLVVLFDMSNMKRCPVYSLMKQRKAANPLIWECGSSCFLKKKWLMINWLLSTGGEMLTASC